MGCVAGPGGYSQPVAGEGSQLQRTSKAGLLLPGPPHPAAPTCGSCTCCTARRSLETRSVSGRTSEGNCTSRRPTAAAMAWLPPNSVAASRPGEMRTSVATMPAGRCTMQATIRLCTQLPSTRSAKRRHGLWLEARAEPERSSDPLPNFLPASLTAGDHPAQHNVPKPACRPTRTQRRRLCKQKPEKLPAL